VVVFAAVMTRALLNAPVAQLDSAAPS